jgi:hypothetical protein
LEDIQQSVAGCSKRYHQTSRPFGVFETHLKRLWEQCC